jgi:hypothetical protein
VFDFEGDGLDVLGDGVPVRALAARAVPFDVCYAVRVHLPHRPPLLESTATECGHREADEKEDPTEDEYGH